MWDLPGPGLKPVSPALAGGFLTTAPPGKSHSFLLRRINGTFDSLTATNENSIAHVSTPLHLLSEPLLYDMFPQEEAEALIFHFIFKFLFIYFLAALLGMRDPSSPTRD